MSRLLVVTLLVAGALSAAMDANAQQSVRLEEVYRLASMQRAIRIGV